MRRAEQRLELGQRLPAAGTRRSRRRRCRRRRTCVGARSPRRAGRCCRAGSRGRRTARRSDRRRAAATPSAVDTKPSMPFTPRFACTRDAVARRHAPLERRAPACSTRRRAPRRRGARRRRHARCALRTARRQPSSTRVDRAHAPPLGVAPRVEPRRSLAIAGRPRSAQRAEQQLRRRRRMRSLTAWRGSSHASSGSTRTWSHDRRRATRSTTLLVGGAPMRSTTSGRCAAGERSVAQQRVVGRDRVRAARAGPRSGRRAPASPPPRRSASTVAAGRVARPSPRPRTPVRAARARGARARRRIAASARATPRSCRGPRSRRPRGRARRRAARRSAPAARGTAG